jgi:small subunit ribosomal protein S15
MVVAKKVVKTKESVQRHEKDTWSPEVQISLLTEEITVLQQHLVLHKQDFDAKRSLLKKVARRRRLLRYLKDTNIKIYTVISKKFDLKA